MSIESGMPSNHLILYHPLLLLPSIFPSIRVFSNESTLQIRWPKYWSFNFSISPSNEYSEFPLGLTDLISLLSKGLSRVFFSTTVQKHQFLALFMVFFMVLLYGSALHEQYEKPTPELHALMCCAHAHSCPTLCNPMDCSLPRSSVHGIFQAGILEWVAIFYSRGSSPPKD